MTSLRCRAERHHVQGRAGAEHTRAPRWAQACDCPSEWLLQRGRELCSGDPHSWGHGPLSAGARHLRAHSGPLACTGDRRGEACPVLTTGPLSVGAHQPDNRPGQSQFCVSSVLRSPEGAEWGGGGECPAILALPASIPVEGGQGTAGCRGRLAGVPEKDNGTEGHFS